MSDYCLGQSDPKDEWNIGLNCFQCHVHLSNEHIELANKSSPIIQAETVELENCEDYHNDVTKKYVNSILLFSFSSRLACRVVLQKDLDGMNVLLSDYESIHH